MSQHPGWPPKHEQGRSRIDQYQAERCGPREERSKLLVRWHAL